MGNSIIGYLFWLSYFGECLRKQGFGCCQEAGIILWLATSINLIYKESRLELAWSHSWFSFFVKAAVTHIRQERRKVGILWVTPWPWVVSFYHTLRVTLSDIAVLWDGLHSRREQYSLAISIRPGCQGPLSSFSVIYLDKYLEGNLIKLLDDIKLKKCSQSQLTMKRQRRCRL